MPSINFVDRSTVIPASWLNEVDAVIYDVLGNPSSVGELLTTLGIAPKTLVETSSSLVIGDSTTGGVYVVNTSSGNVTIELPPVSENAEFTIKKITTDSNTVTVIPDSGGSDTIDLAANAVLPGSLLNSITLRGTDSHGWVII